jgi:3-dehydroquinate dehydratase II
MKIHIINGPNINLIGTREPEIYGQQSFNDFFETLKSNFPAHSFTTFQSNHEGELVTDLQDTLADGVILNAAAFTHTSIAIADAIKAIKIPVIEVHISNVYAREEVRHISLIKAYSIASISGMGMHSYTLAVYGLDLFLA